MRAMQNFDALRLAVSSTLVTAARHWRRASHGLLAAYNVSEACAAPLLIAGRLGAGVRQVTLAEQVGIEGPSLVRLLDQLCAAGLMRRDEDPDDRRAKTISLTDEGRAITATIEKELTGLRGEVLEGVSRADLEATLRVLTLFNGSKRVAAPRRAPVQEPAQESAQRNPKRPDTAP
jgi:MarR family transcriptional regulator for hemolysin